MATIKDLAEQYGLEDYEQLLGGYPNAKKFITGLKDAAVRSVPTTEQMRDPNFIIDTAGLGGAIKAYHGTPHLFDRFDMSKLGTGEGAQSYGHGLYFAQDPSIAESYRKNLSRDADVIYQAELNGVPVDLRSLKGAPNLALASMVSEPNRSIDDIIKTYREGDHSKPYARLWPDVANFLEENRDNIKIYDKPIKHTGKIYETSIQWPNAEREAMDPLGEHHLLDWDRPAEGYVKEAIPRKIRELQNARDAISSKYVDDEFNPDDLFSNTYSFPSNEDKAAMDKIAEEIVMHKNMSPAFDKGAEGRTTYYKLEKMLGSPEKASEYLHSLDIPGIKYLDASSRNTDNGTRNFVTFGDEYPQIVKRAGSLDELQEKYAEGGAVDSAISDYKQLLSGYPNATKFVNALQSSIESHIPTTEDLQSPERMGEWSLAAALNQPTGLATKPIKNLNQALLDKYIESGYLPEDELAKYEKNAAKMRNAGRQDINVQNAQANPEYDAYKAEYDVPFMHGTERLDRVLSKEGLDPKRATSGPMLYGTDSPEIASSYAKNKQDTSMMDDEDWDYSKAFTVAPQQLGHRGTIPYTVEQSWNYLDPEVKRDILTKAPRVGYSDLDQWQGDFVLHPEGEDNAIINQSHYDYLLKQSRGNPIKAMRDYWLDSGNLFNEEEKMSQLYRLAGYPHEISQEMAPWTKREGVLTGVSRIRNPLDTSNVDELREKVIPALKDAFKNDRSRKKDYGADSWDKNTRYTPKEWVNELEDDLNKGENSYVWTSIPDKITSELKRLGYNGIYDTGGKSAGADSHQVTIPFNPSQIRSKFAAFDPILKHSPNLLAGTALGSVLLHDDNQGYAEGGSVDKDSLQLNKPQRTPSHPTKSHIVKTMVDGKEKIIRFGEQGAETAGKPKEGESDRMTAKRESFKARHAKNIAKGPSSAAYWANKVKWAEGGEVDIRDDSIMSKLDELAGGGDYAEDLEQLKRAYPNATKFFNATQSALEEAVPTTEQMRDPDYLIEHLNPMALSMSAPEKTVNAYKLFRTKANDPDTLYPLFVNADKPVLKDEWIPAEAGAPASQNSDKVKSLLGPLAYRPGWHAGDVPVATHIGKGGKPPVYRPSEHTWAEVEFPNDIDWQTLANERGMNKKGVIVPKFAHITDQLPEGGFYRYKTSPNMTGEWLIGGSMKLGKHLSDDEVKAINEASGLGVEDLPRFHEYLSRNADNPSELSRVINSSAGKDEYFQMLKNARDNEIDDLLKRYSEFTDDKALSAMDKRYNKYLKKGYAEGGSVDAQDDEGYADKASSYLDDLAQLKEAYPNANKFMSALKDAAYRSVPTTEQMMDPEFILENAGFGGLSTKLLKPMKASEAYGRIEGRPLYVTQADRTKVGGKFLGGPGFSRLQLEDPEYAEALAAWAVQNPSIASTIINGSRQAGEHDPVFTTFIGAPDQHRSNQMVFDYIYNDFKKASKKSDLFTPEKLDLMNERLANYYKDKSTKENLFPENINILDKNLKNYANTFDKRAAIAEVIGGKGIGGKKGQIIDYDKLLRSTSDPSFLDVPSGSLGNRLFTLNGEFLENRHDLHPAFPTILQGEDLGLVYQPVPRELVMKDFHNKIRQEKGREPGYFDWALGYPPSQLITEDLLTEMQRAGYAKGGEVKDLHNKYEESDYGYGNRPDKTKKGLGYFGELERPDGTGVMTEYSIGVPIHGEEMDVPTLVPTLTPDEIRLILHMQDGDDMPRSIVHKAIDHAHQRLSEGKPIFATEEDLYAHGGIVDVLHNDAIEQIMKAFMDSMADDEEPSAPAVSIEITTQNTETPRRGKIPKSIAREAKHG